MGPGLQVGSLFADRFLIEAVLGEGGMGTVYLAQHEVLQRRVAIKVINANQAMDRVMAARFRQEARAASRVEHPHITSVFDFGQTDDGRPYLVMEYAEGPTLRDILAGERLLELARGLSILRQIAEALAAAHACQVVHRDLKPGNVVLTTHRGEPDFVKILDFGLAKVIGQDESLSREGEAMGTPAYMSPEQCMAAEVDHRCDVYAFGILAYEVIVGQVPFGGRIVEVASAHVNDRPPVPSVASGREEVTPALDALVLRCLAKRPADRFQDAAEIIAELDELLRVARARCPARSTSEPCEDDDAPTVARSGFDGLGPVSIPLAPVPALQEEHWDEESTVQWLQQLEPELQDLSPAAIEEIACVLRDRGLGTPELSEAMAQKLRAEDRLMELEARADRLRGQIANAEQTARDREARLRRALAQLEHERSQLKRRQTQFFAGAMPLPGETTRAEQLEAHVRGVSGTIQEIARNAAKEIGALQQSLTMLPPELQAARQEAGVAAQRLMSLVQQIGQQTLAERQAEREHREDTDVDPLRRSLVGPAVEPLAETVAASPLDEPDEPTAADRPTAKAMLRQSARAATSAAVSSRLVTQVAGTVDSTTGARRLATADTAPHAQTPSAPAPFAQEPTQATRRAPAPAAKRPVLWGLLLIVIALGGAGLLVVRSTRDAGSANVAHAADAGAALPAADLAAAGDARAEAAASAAEATAAASARPRP